MTGILEPIIAGIIVSLVNRFILNKQNLLPLLQQQQGLTGESTAINSASASVASSSSSSQNNGVVHMSH
jgi:hypothetical protein